MGGWRGFSWTDGLVVACALLQRRVRFGLRPSSAEGLVVACALIQRRVWFGLRPHSTEGLVWPAPLSHLPTLQRFWVQGDSPCTPGGGCAPCTPLGRWRGQLSHLPPGTGVGTRCVCWTDGLVVASAVLQRRVRFGLRRCPTCPPSNVFGDRGTPPVPPAGAAPPAPRLGEEEGIVAKRDIARPTPVIARA